MLDMLSLAVGQCKVTNDSFAITLLILLQPKDSRRDTDLLVNSPMPEEIPLYSPNINFIV
jgi:hypothetical protein